MIPYTKHLIAAGSLIKEALARLNELAADAILFVVDDYGRLVASLTDGDVRRGFLRGLTFEDNVDKFTQQNPRYLVKGRYSIEQVIEYRRDNFRIIPIVDNDKKVIDVLNFRFKRSALPIDAVIMAGGRGERLRPLTDITPKPLLSVGGKPIIKYNLERLASFGVNNIWISIRYLGEQIVETVGDGRNEGQLIKYVHEDEPLGTIGAARKIEDFGHQHVLVCNSDLLTNLDYEAFYQDFVQQDAALSIVTIPYSVNVPYAVLETSNGHVISFKEKPTYTYYSNGGIYLLKRDVLKDIPVNTFYNATDLMDALIARGMKVISFPMHGYWLDIGKHEDFSKANEDIKHIKL
jgi:dTDP-glucose pyrophosphorylase